MIDVKTAVPSARSYVDEVLGEFKPTVEKIERVLQISAIDFTHLRERLGAF